MQNNWVDIKGYEDLYKINRQGGVMSLKHETKVNRHSQKSKKVHSYVAKYKTKMLKMIYTTGNVPVVHLYKDGIMTSFTIKKLLKVNFPDLTDESLNNIIKDIQSHRDNSNIN